jgi:hypothetical protein
VKIKTQKVPHIYAKVYLKLFLKQKSLLSRAATTANGLDQEIETVAVESFVGTACWLG